MSALSKILIGGAGVAALVGVASPAAAQYYPGPYGYNNGGGVVGAIINAIGGYGQYPYGNYGYGQTNDNYAVNQCSRAVEARLNQSGYGYRQPYGYGQPYGYPGYANPYGGARIAGITRIERKSNGRLKVYGVAMSNAGYGNQPYGYGYQNAARPDLRFNCKIDRYGRVTDVDIDRMAYNQNDYYYGYRRY
jgi:hypothetical protein